MTSSAADSSGARELAYVGAGNERLAAGTRQDYTAHCRVVSRVLECSSQILPCRCIQSIEHLRSIDRCVGYGAFLFVYDIRERQP